MTEAKKIDLKELATKIAQLPDGELRVLLQELMRLSGANSVENVDETITIVKNGEKLDVT